MTSYSQPFLAKIRDLSPPYGLRRGVLPLLLAAIMHPRLPVLTLRQNRRVVSPLTSEIFTTLVKKPAPFAIKVGKWDNKRKVLWDVLEEDFKDYLTEQERHGQPLEYLSIGMLRWLQSLPRYCRDTNHLREQARTFRKLIRKAQRDPASVLLYDLLELLENDSDTLPSVAAQSESVTRGSAFYKVLAKRLSELKNEIATAYQALLYSLDRFTIELFAAEALSPISNGRMALDFWLTQLQQHTEEPIETLRFNDALVTRLIKVNSLGFETNAEGIQFWNRLSEAVLGIAFHDWNDQSVKSFKNKLSEAKERAEREIVELSEDEAVIELQLNMPNPSAEERSILRNGEAALPAEKAHPQGMISGRAGETTTATAVYPFPKEAQPRPLSNHPSTHHG